MNREIKFRVWIEDRYMSQNERDLLRLKSLQMGEYMVNYAGVKSTPIKVMQYTGLKDKNGREIYEGDILKVQLPMGGFWGDIKKQKTGLVNYESDYGGFNVRWEYSRNQYHVLLTCDTAFEGEVIGNKFQNPELLNITI